MRDFKLVPLYFARAFGDAPAYKGIVAFTAAVAEYLFGTETLTRAAIAAGGLLVLDTITGLVAAWARGEGYQSGKLSRVLVKVVSYGSAVVVCRLAAESIPGLMAVREAAMTAVVGAIAATEILSNIENIDKMGFKGLGWLARFLRGRLKEDDRFDPEKPE